MQNTLIKLYRSSLHLLVRDGFDNTASADPFITVKADMSTRPDIPTPKHTITISPYLYHSYGITDEDRCYFRRIPSSTKGRKSFRSEVQTDTLIVRPTTLNAGQGIFTHKLS